MTTSERSLQPVAVFTGAKPGTSPTYMSMARELGTVLAQAGMALVYGGGKVGLMGAVADGALAAGGEVVGVMPQHLFDREIAHPQLTRLEACRPCTNASSA